MVNLCFLAKDVLRQCLFCISHDLDGLIYAAVTMIGVGNSYIKRFLIRYIAPKNFQGEKRVLFSFCLNKYKHCGFYGIPILCNAHDDIGIFAEVIAPIPPELMIHFQSQDIVNPSTAACYGTVLICSKLSISCILCNRCDNTILNQVFPDLG